jgi:hypothetical protein
MRVPRQKEIVQERDPSEQSRYSGIDTDERRDLLTG